MKDIIAYIVRFLIGANAADEICSYVGYTDDKEKFGDYKLVIHPSPFFRPDIYGTEASLPLLPLSEIENVPFLFGTPEMEYIGDTLVVHADIIASTYFLVSRYEETVRRDVRDMHGRFYGKESLPYRGGFIDRPVVDEYGRLLRQWLRRQNIDIPEPPRTLKKIYLTHDVDAPFYCRTFRSVVRELVARRNIFRALDYYFGALENDPNYTFPWLLVKDNEVRETWGKERCEILLFFKPSGKTAQDKPHYKIDSDDMKTLFALCKTMEASVGLHSSYEAGLNPELIANERTQLEQAWGMPVDRNRHHYLGSREPEDMAVLVRAGITDDFTMGYADVAGFRLGTSQPVRWIDPLKKEITALTLHPLTVMECTLDGSRYMNMEYEEALDYCCRLIDRSEKANGEIALLWHNDTVVETHLPPGYAPWQRKLYGELLNDLKNKGK